MQFNLRRNATAAVLEVIISGAVLFILYKIIVGQLGIQSLGVWSLVLATSSLMRFADIGTVAGLSRFVAISSGRHDARLITAYVDTALLANAALYSILSLLLYWPAYEGLQWAIQDPAPLLQARALLPYALASFIVASLAGAVTTSLVGLQRSDLRSLTAIGGVLVQITAALWLIGSLGLVGLALAQMLQNVFVLLTGWVLVHKKGGFGSPLRLPNQWNWSIFRELVGFGVRLQISTILGFMYEPATKFVMSSLGGLEALGTFEMAQRLVLQTRLLVVTPTQTFVPAFAYASEHDPSRVGELYRAAIGMAVTFGVPLFVALTAISPLVGYFWIGQFNSLFVAFVTILSAGWFVNLYAAPAYLLGVGTGRLFWNIAGSVLTSLGGPLLGLLLGHFGGDFGVVVGAILMLAVGSSLSIMNCRERGIAPFARWSDITGAVGKLIKRAKLA